MRGRGLRPWLHPGMAHAVLAQVSIPLMRGRGLRLPPGLLPPRLRGAGVSIPLMRGRGLRLHLRPQQGRLFLQVSIPLMRGRGLRQVVYMKARLATGG